MSDFFSRLVSLVKSHPLIAGLFFLVLTVFLAGPFLYVYRAIRNNVPGASALPAK